MKFTSVGLRVRIRASVRVRVTERVRVRVGISRMRVFTVCNFPYKQFPYKQFPHKQFRYIIPSLVCLWTSMAYNIPISNFLISKFPISPVRAENGLEG